ncbi:multiprotein-bridging factor 1 family protein [Streptomyces sp. NPDC021224]|uniref:helix-turn-helix domain-containing protein n=1 Tax=unclassified Streptomyces TaxID=2593676 RepID=UPI0037973769
MSEENTGNTAQRIAAELKRVRQEAGLSQEQMAQRLGIVYEPGGRKVSTGRAAVSAWERGRRRPALHHLQAYVGMGADPALLTLDPEPGPASADPAEPADALEPADAPAAEGADGPTADAHAGPAPARRRGRRWWWTAVLPVAAAAGLGGALLAGAFRGDPPRPAVTWSETTGTPAHTWANATQLTGAGKPLGPQQSVQVSCRIRGYVVPDGDPWWYRLDSAPWKGHYYATSDAFYNNGATSGPVDTGVVVDEQVPLCS